MPTTEFLAPNRRHITNRTVRRTLRHAAVTIIAVWLALVSVIPTPAPAQAQPPDDQLGESLLFVILFPQLRQLPPPLWFRPGVRVTYDAIGANFQGGAAGGGLAQYDVVALDIQQGVVSALNFIDNGAGALIPVGATAKIGLPAVGEIWINPTVFVGAESVAVGNPNLSITRRNDTFNGQAIQVIRFQSDTQGGRRTVWEFDANTGLLLFYSQAVQGAANQLSLRNIRTVNLPWQGSLAPNWVRPGAHLDYNGLQSQFIPSVGTINTPFRNFAQIEAATTRWSLQSQTQFLNGIASPTLVTVSGIGQPFGGFWLPVEALATNIPTPVVVDVDPVTGAQISVERDANGNLVVQETAPVPNPQATPVYQTTLVYNRDLGALDRFFQEVHSLTNVTQIDVSRTGGSNLAQLSSQPPLQELPMLPADPSNPGDPDEPNDPDELAQVGAQVFILMVAR